MLKVDRGRFEVCIPLDSVQNGLLSWWLTRGEVGPLVLDVSMVN